MSYDGEYDASEYPDGINAPRLGYRGSREMAALRAEKDAVIARLSDTLRAARDELTRWGWGDMHYGPTPQERTVVDMVNRCNEALGDGPYVGVPVPRPEDVM